MLTNWNFKDEASNSTTPQINRQKSARNLQIVQFDPSEPHAVFFDAKRSEKHTATLTKCDCDDFNRVGSGIRKSFKPCMHIYRLAIELGLIEAKYLDHRARYAQAWLLTLEETQRLQRLSPDSAQWGGWASEVHASGIQRNRQYRAYSIACEEKEVGSQINGGWIIHGYNTTLNHCECGDFSSRVLPCKHIYAAALASKINLPFSETEYMTAKNQGIGIVFEFPTA